MTGPNPKRNNLKRFRHRFGWWTLVLPLATLVIVVCTLSLGCFWQWGNRKAIEDYTGIWSNIALAHQSTQVVIITTALLRTCIAAQYLICYSIIASLALTYGCVKGKEDIKMMYIFQYANSGPLDLILPVTRGLRWNARSIFLFIVMILMTGLTIVSQLFSTILLWDMFSTDLHGKNVTDQVFYNLSNFNYTDYHNGYREQIYPLEFPLFAERADDRHRYMVNGSQSSPGIGDTGTVQRAFLPLTSSHLRMSLAQYNGPAGIVQTRLICFPPQFDEMNLTIFPKTRSSVIGSQILDVRLSSPLSQVRGHLAWINSHQPPQAKPLGLPNLSDFQWSQCQFTGRFPYVSINLMKPTMGCNDNGLQWGLFLKNPGNSGGQIFDAANTSMNTANTTFQGEWAISKFSSTAKRTAFTLQYSLCVGRVAEIPAVDIFVKAEPNYTEPVLDKGPKRRIVATNSIQHQFGVAGPKNLSERISLSERKVWNLSRIDQTQFELFTMQLPPRNIFSNPRQSNWYVVYHRELQTMTVCNKQANFNWISITLETLFNDVLETTGSLALAIESFSTVQFSANYYRYLDTVDSKGAVTYKLFQQERIPRTWTGFAIVAGCNSLHLLLVALILITYAFSKTSVQL